MTFHWRGIPARSLCRFRGWCWPNFSNREQRNGFGRQRPFHVTSRGRFGAPQLGACAHTRHRRSRATVLSGGSGASWCAYRGHTPILSPASGFIAHRQINKVFQKLRTTLVGPHRAAMARCAFTTCATLGRRYRQRHGGALDLCRPRQDLRYYCVITVDPRKQLASGWLFAVPVLQRAGNSLAKQF